MRLSASVIAAKGISVRPSAVIEYVTARLGEEISGGIPAPVNLRQAGSSGGGILRSSPAERNSFRRSEGQNSKVRIETSRVLPGQARRPEWMSIGIPRWIEQVAIGDFPGMKSVSLK